MKHLVDIESLSDAEIQEILELAGTVRRGGAARARGPVATLFYEPSTRTEMSFLRACQIVGAEVLRLAPETSSATKGEGPVETVKTLFSIGARTVVIRTSEPLLPRRLTTIGPSIVNAGDGAHAHPTQALADAATLMDAIGADLSGLTVVMAGDHLHSRVSRSSATLLARLGCRVVLVGPPSLNPPELARALGAQTAASLDEALDAADVVMALRIQRERQGAGLVPDAAEYRRVWGVTEERFRAHPHLLLMHPGPANLGVEVDSTVVDDERSLIRRQVAMGPYIRASVLTIVGRGQDA